MVAHGVHFFCESGCFHHVDDKHVTDYRHQRCARGWSQSERTNFRRVACPEADVGYFGKLAVVVACDDNDLQFRVHAFGKGYKLDDFAGLARVGKQEHDVVALHYAEVAVLCFARVKEYSRNTG